MARRYILKTKPRAYVERDRYGRFKKWTAMRKSAKPDRRVKARTIVRSDYGHRGDQKRRRKRLF